MIYDLYVIGGRRGFYVGQAKHLKAGGWKRRIAQHRSKKSGVKPAHALLMEGKRARLVGSIAATRGYANLIEARLWDSFVDRGWNPVHPRPRHTERWGDWVGKKHTPETCAKLSAAHRGKPNNWKGRKHSAETRSKISAAKMGKPGPWLGKKRSTETRARISATLSSPEALRKSQEAGRRGGCKGGKVTAEKNYQDGWKQLHAIGFASGKQAHKRWHVNRGIVNSSCKWCTLS